MNSPMRFRRLYASYSSSPDFKKIKKEPKREPHSPEDRHGRYSHRAASPPKIKRETDSQELSMPSTSSGSARKLELSAYRNRSPPAVRIKSEPFSPNRENGATSVRIKTEATTPPRQTGWFGRLYFV